MITSSFVKGPTRFKGGEGYWKMYSLFRIYRKTNSITGKAVIKEFMYQEFKWSYVGNFIHE